MHHPSSIPLDAHSLFADLLSDCPPVDLSAPYHPHVPFETPRTRAPTSFEDSPSDDSASDADSHPTPSLPGKRSPSDAQSPDQRRRDHHNTHTRRCRARLNWRFDALNRMLPAVDNAQVKHKVHILDHALNAITALHAENNHLRLRVALRSNASLLQWIDTFAPTAPTPVDALKPVLDILTFVGGWAYAEIWEKLPGGNFQMKHFAVKSSALLQPALANLGNFAMDAHVPNHHSDMIAHVFSTARPVWTDNVLDQCRDPARRQVLSAARLKSALALPVLVDGEVTHLVAMYDVRDRPRDPKLLKFATFVTVMVGNAFGAAQAQREYEAPSGPTPKPPLKTSKAAKAAKSTAHTPRRVGQKAKRDVSMVMTPKRPKLTV